MKPKERSKKTETTRGPQCKLCGRARKDEETFHGYIECTNNLYDDNQKLRELCQRAYENLEDDIENKPMRHSCGRLIAELRTALEIRREP